MWTDWWCKRCHASGVIQSKGEAGVWEVNQQLQEAHDRTREAARERCTYSIHTVRVHLRVRKRKVAGSADGGGR